MAQKKGNDNALKKGCDQNTQFNKWLKANGIKLTPPPDTGDFIQDLNNRVRFIKEREKLLEGQIALYKSINARGHTVFGQLMELETDILTRRNNLKQEGKDPIDDKPLQDAEHRRFEMMKFLEKIKFDKDKAAVDFAIRKSTNDKDGDNLFEYDPEYVVKDNELHKDNTRDN